MVEQWGPIELILISLRKNNLARIKDSKHVNGIKKEATNIVTLVGGIHIKGGKRKQPARGWGRCAGTVG